MNLAAFRSAGPSTSGHEIQGQGGQTESRQIAAYVRRLLEGAALPLALALL